ncbi:MAG: hypothetical protein JNL58_12205 [Planctomyces sp.]|nr:hypothetical protein [Planctomyces sp.]
MAERSKRDHLAALAEPVVGDEFSRQQEVEEEANDKQTLAVCCGAAVLRSLRLVVGVLTPSACR